MSNDAALQSGSRTTVGLFVAMGLGLVLLVGLAMGYEQGWFRKTFTLYVESVSAEGLKPGMSVRLSGIPVGKVAAIELTENAQIRTVLHIDENFHGYLHADTQAHLAREGWFGDAYIVLQSDNRPGQSAGAPIADAARIPFDEGLSMAELVTQIKNKVLPMLDQINGVTHKLNDNKGAFQGSLQDTQAQIRHLRASLGLVDTTLKNTGQLTGAQIPQTLAHANATLDGVASLAAHADQRLQALSLKAEVLAQKYGQTGDEASQALQELQALLHETQQELKALSGNLQTHWPFTGPAAAASAAQPR